MICFNLNPHILNATVAVNYSYLTVNRLYRLYLCQSGLIFIFLYFEDNLKYIFLVHPHFHLNVTFIGDNIWGLECKKKKKISPGFLDPPPLLPQHNGTLLHNYSHFAKDPFSGFLQIYWQKKRRVLTANKARPQGAGQLGCPAVMYPL